jgi:hypothetical protein
LVAVKLPIGNWIFRGLGREGVAAGAEADHSAPDAIKFWGAQSEDAGAAPGRGRGRTGGGGAEGDGGGANG